MLKNKKATKGEIEEDHHRFMRFIHEQKLNNN